jgi:hypothetical protein
MDYYLPYTNYGMDPKRLLPVWITTYLTQIMEWTPKDRYLCGDKLHK